MSGFLETVDNVIQTYNQYVGHSFRIISGKYDRKEDAGDINHFRALTTALSATVGTGNIVGVALAIYFGGPGAVFWMWVTGLFGMMLKFVECTLSQKFRKINPDGSVSGGPMYYMEMGLKNMLGPFAKVLAIIFAIATVLCSFGTGNMAQSNSMADVLQESYHIPVAITGVFVTLMVLLVIVGGIKRIAHVTSRLVPFMAAFYLLAGLLIIGIYYKEIPATFYMIVTDAFTGTAATGGFIGAAFIVTLRYGVARGLFSNEAGQGSAAIAHSAAKTTYPVREGLVASVGPFIDTLIICTITALVIIMTGAWTEADKGVAMTVMAFETGLNKINLGFAASHIVALGLLMFAFSTMISWSYYGSKAAEYLLGQKWVVPYRYLYGLFVFLGAIWGIDLVWHFVDMVITFMTIPNLIALLLLTPVVNKEVKAYFKIYKTL
jgi:AGCS family alanine or glycine:cation symporter